MRNMFLNEMIVLIILYYIMNIKNLFLLYQKLKFMIIIKKENMILLFEDNVNKFR